MKEISEVVELDESVQEQLNNAVNTYFEKNLEYKSAENTKNIYNTNLKTLLNEYGLTKYVSDMGIKASLATTTKSALDEESLIPVLKDMGIEGLIKTKEYIDMEVLENAIYHKQIDPAILVPFKVDSTTTRLTVTKSKILKEG